MSAISTVRLYLLRGMYLLIAVGLGITIWPSIVGPPGTVASESTVLWASLGALAVVSALGLRNPLQMLPVLWFELLWKLIRVVAFALRMWLATALDEYASKALFACLMGIMLVPIVMPWCYVFKHYVGARAEPWVNAETPRTGRPFVQAVPVTHLGEPTLLPPIATSLS